MEKKSMSKKKIVAISVAAVILVTVVLLGWCFLPRRVNGKVWSYQILKDGNVALIGLNPKAVPEDGVLRIPAKIGLRKVVGFGVITSSGPGGSHGDMFDLPEIQKLIVEAGVPVTYTLWFSSRIIELESTDPGEVVIFSGVSVRLIVPDGCRDDYIEAIETQQKGLSIAYCILEKSEVVDWYVDDDGLLKGYFGLEPDHFVLPSGIKKIDSGSFGGGDAGSPKTIILNEDLERIEENGLNFGGYRESIEEIRFPESVKYIGAGVASVKKVYLYRSTEVHERAFGKAEIIYLD